MTKVDNTRMLIGKFPARSVQAGMWQKIININT
jgi:hypothetical protein